jgi:hypothetical protein
MMATAVKVRFGSQKKYPPSVIGNGTLGVCGGACIYATPAAPS